MTAREAPREDEPQPVDDDSLSVGVWLAHYYDGSDVTAFATEVEALRHAVGNGSNVIFVRYGESLTDAIRRVRQGTIDGPAFHQQSDAR